MLTPVSFPQSFLSHDLGMIISVSEITLGLLGQTGLAGLGY